MRGCVGDFVAASNNFISHVARAENHGLKDSLLAQQIGAIRVI